MFSKPPDGNHQPTDEPTMIQKFPKVVMKNCQRDYGRQTERTRDRERVNSERETDMQMSGCRDNESYEI